MKRSGLSRTIVAIAMMLIGWLPSLANDFVVDGIYYNKISSSNVEAFFNGSLEDEDVYLDHIVIPSSVNYNGMTYRVTSIGWSAFEECYSLTSVEIPNSVTSIGENAFRNCSSLISIQIPNSVTSIGSSAFDGCSSLTSIVVDSGNAVYDSRNGCNAIIETASNTLIAGCQNTIIPNSVTSIGNYAFNECSSLTSVVIPNSVTSIGDYAFYRCSNLTSVVILNSVTSIGENAFTFCVSLTSIEIPGSVKSIGSGAFSDCESLTSIEIPNSVISIGDGAFGGCTSLTCIDIPNSVISIGVGAFYGCSSLTSVVIGNSVTSIGVGAFGECESLTKITCWSTTPPEIKSDIYDYYFEDENPFQSNITLDLYVPAGCEATYKSAEYWMNLNIIELPSSATYKHP